MRSHLIEPGKMVKLGLGAISPLTEPTGFLKETCGVVRIRIASTTRSILNKNKE